MEARKIIQTNVKKGTQDSGDRAARVAARVTAKIALAKGATMGQALLIQQQLLEELAEDTGEVKASVGGSLHCIASARVDLCRDCKVCTVKGKTSI
ncbi:hypothetical protein [Microbulbifer sp. THAF38]|uniref:hypothetical protein n=1 Tax=Microbulbifer sp. THAF38 TaxID=2587856 RepID=UPI001268CA41|nr:hypothetical protein [Microbulbifer sp. THAF38]QFT56612.1 hypothetical protein FIU95_18855 [Microbulbifer sp. THAF38]